MESILPKFNLYQGLLNLFRPILQELKNSDLSENVNASHEICISLDYTQDIALNIFYASHQHESIYL